MSRRALRRAFATDRRHRVRVHRVAPALAARWLAPERVAEEKPTPEDRQAPLVSQGGRGARPRGPLRDRRRWLRA